MTMRRWLGLAVATGGTLALSAPAAQARPGHDAGVRRGHGRGQDPGWRSNTVRFTMTRHEPGRRRACSSTRKGQGRGLHRARQPGRARGRARGLQPGVEPTLPGVHRARRSARPTRSRRPTVRSCSTSARTSSRRRSRWRWTTAPAAGPTARGSTAQRGRPSASRRRPAVLSTPLDWVAPASPTDLRAVGTPHAITLFWTPPADAVGVRYQVVETLPDGSGQPGVRVGHRQRGDDLGARARQRAHLPPARLPLLGRPDVRPAFTGGRDGGRHRVRAAGRTAPRAGARPGRSSRP